MPSRPNAAMVVSSLGFMAHHVVILWVASANRDAAQFSDPDRFDIHRSPNPHLAFGHGIHFCLGAPLARLEGEIAVTRLAERLPQIRLCGAEPEWHDSLILRGVKSLPVALT
jgi:cytochrome P450